MHAHDSISRVLKSLVWSAFRMPRFDMQLNIIAQHSRLAGSITTKLTCCAIRIVVLAT
jgi:hypothetical protein